MKDGTWRGSAIGYVGEATATVTLQGGPIMNLAVGHRDNITHGADKTMVARIIEGRTLAVEGVTGATVTSQAVITATYEALKKVGAP